MSLKSAAAFGITGSYLLAQVKGHKMIPAQEAIQMLKDGNRRFVAGDSTDLRQTHKLVDNQEPFAIVLGCSDSRVPPEIVFNQGVGDLFVIRIAGNIVTPLELGSAEFAATKFGTRLVVVLGHSSCGAVKATVETLESGKTAQTADLSPGMQSIVEQISASVDLKCGCSPEAIVDRAINANVRNSVKRISSESIALNKLVKDEGLMVVGARYDIATGAVEFLD